MQQEEVLIYSFFQFSSLNIVHFNGTFAQERSRYKDKGQYFSPHYKLKTTYISEHEDLKKSSKTQKPQSNPEHFTLKFCP